MMMILKRLLHGHPRARPEAFPHRALLEPRCTQGECCPACPSRTCCTKRARLVSCFGEAVRQTNCAWMLMCVSLI